MGKVFCSFCTSLVNDKLDYCESCGVPMGEINRALEETVQLDVSSFSPKFNNPNYKGIGELDVFN